MTDEVSSHPDMDWDVIGRYLAGESTAAEAAAVRDWLAKQPADAELLSTLDAAILRVAERAAVPVNVEDALRRARARRDTPPQLTVSRGRQARTARDRWRTLGIPVLAAATIAVAAVGLWRSGAVQGRGAEFAGLTVETSVGERDSLMLPDGTAIQLGPDTRLTVAAGYGRARREVRLEGRAFFDVKHDAAHPFTVLAGPALVQDLGTSFVVDQIEPEHVRVVVTSGIVSLRDVALPDSAVELREGDVGEVQPPRRIVKQRGAARSEDVAWREGRLVFREAPLSVVRAELRRWYGVELRVADPTLANRHISAEFAGEPVDQVLSAIALSLGAEIERRGDTAVVRAARRGVRVR